ncbi:MAG: aminotransferase class IV, partial [Verrucomicrobiales bacterium]|nr:aminotransferase class IV [Verrucomicrobiales bacterium]
KTPPVSSGCLPGITRDTVLKLAKESGIKIEEADLPLTRVTEIESAFLTSTMRGIQPVLKIDSHDLRDTAGEWHALANTYQKLVSR